MTLNGRRTAPIAAGGLDMVPRAHRDRRNTPVTAKNLACRAPSAPGSAPGGDPNTERLFEQLPSRVSLTKRLYGVAKIQRVNSLEKREKTTFFAKKEIHSLDFWGTFPGAFPGQVRERTPISCILCPGKSTDDRYSPTSLIGEAVKLKGRIL